MCGFQSAERAYANIALAYDRFLKAGDLYKAYDPITSTEPFYANIPVQEAIKYDATASPKVADQVSEHLPTLRPSVPRSDCASGFELVRRPPACCFVCPLH